MNWIVKNFNNSEKLMQEYKKNFSTTENPWNFKRKTFKELNMNAVEKSVVYLMMMR